MRSFVTQTDRTYYRVYSGESTSGQYLVGSRPNSADEAVAGLSLPPWNRADFIQEVEVPTMTRMMSSIAGPIPEWAQPGGMLQFELLDRIPIGNFGPGVPFR
jgi:hypothetical protein